MVEENYGHNVSRLPISMPLLVPTTSSTDSGPGHLNTSASGTLANLIQAEYKINPYTIQLPFIDPCHYHENVSRVACGMMWLSCEGELSVPSKGHPRQGSPQPTMR